MFALASCISAPLFAQSLQTIPSLPLATFQDSLGVNLHIEYTDGQYANAAAVLSDLQFLGIHNVRDQVPQPANWLPVGQGLAAMQMLGANGIHFDLIAAPNQALATNMQQLDNLQKTQPGMVISVEGPNEINNQPVTAPGLSNEQAAENYQRSLYSAVHSDSNFANVPVYYLTGGDQIDLSANPGLADYENGHPYPHTEEQPWSWLQLEFNQRFINPSALPKAVTESGYYTLPQSTDWGGVDEPGQAELVLNDYFDAALQGIVHTYMYQLLDAYPDPTGTILDDHFGFFHLDGTPKVLAYAMNNLSRAFPQDKASSPVTVQAAISGLPASTGHAFALTGSDGSIAVFLWNEAPVWNTAAQILQWVTPVPVTVQIPGSWNVSYFTPALPATIPLSGSNGTYTTTVASYPTALIFRKQ
ncbi:hypothetical protein [Acidipila sp. EB88]|uniref:hypothetical protein n=1 Tax=Acidipila sp. EB88 TaxID=2305226 RepID=UPI000F5E1B84|nr:hypothetical protein [Acidipila sp. EB88]